MNRSGMQTRSPRSPGCCCFDCAGDYCGCTEAIDEVPGESKQIVIQRFPAGTNLKNYMITRQRELAEQITPEMMATGDCFVRVADATMLKNSTLASWCGLAVSQMTIANGVLAYDAIQGYAAGAWQMGDTMARCSYLGFAVTLSDDLRDLTVTPDPVPRSAIIQLLIFDLVHNSILALSSDSIGFETSFGPLPRLYYRNQAEPSTSLPREQLGDRRLDPCEYLHWYLSLLFSLSAYLSIPYWAAVIVSDSEAGLIHLMRMSGLTFRSYWSATCLFCFLFSTIQQGVYWIVVTAACTRCEHNVAGPIPSARVLGVLLLGPAGVTSLSLVLSSAFRSSLTAGLFSSLAAIACTLTAAILMIVAGLPAVDQGLVLCLLPPFGLVRVAFLSWTAVVVTPSGEKTSDDRIFMIAFFLTAVGNVLFGALGLFLHALRTLDIAAHLKARFVQHFTRAPEPAQILLSMQTSDISVQREAAVVDEQLTGEHISSAVLLSRLSKSFWVGHREKKAVNGVDLHVEYSECIGLLGPWSEWGG